MPIQKGISGKTFGVRALRTMACDVQRNSPALVRHTLLMRAGFAPAAVEIAGYFVHQLRSDNDPAHLASAGRDVGGQSRNCLSGDRPAGACRRA